MATFDLSTDLGVSGQLNAPILVDAVRYAERVVLESGIALGGAALSKEQTEDVIRRGYRVLAHGFDALVLKAHVREALSWGRH
jgi:4-hydroxy-2-oxoheptanedioate aldolase